MKIAESNITLASSSVTSSKREVNESLRAWTGDVRPDFEGRETAGTSAPASSTVSLSDAGKAAQSNDVASDQSSS